MPAAFMRIAPFGVVRPWNSQYGKPEDGICTPHCVTLPDASRLVSFLRELDASRSQFAGGLFGIEAGLLEQLLVPVEDDGRALERDAPGLAAGLAVHP